jgi:hypothetical protein
MPFELQCAFCRTFWRGAIAQLGERLAGSQKVLGSNPISYIKRYAYDSSALVLIVSIF